MTSPTFKALLTTRTDDGLQTQLVDYAPADMMDGDVSIAVDWSTINYKDGLAITGKAPVISTFPLIPGIDLVGRVTASQAPGWEAGDLVVLNGDGIGESRHGGFATRARVRGRAWQPG